MINTKLFLSFTFFLFLSLNIYAQTSYENGYYINNEGRKVECLILNKDWKNNPTQFQLKTSLDSTVKRLSINDVQEFGIYRKKKYKRFTVLIDKSSDNLGYLSDKRKTEFQKDTLFLNELIQGKASLYIYRKNNLTRFFYTSDTIQAEQLIYKLYQLKGQKTVRTNNHFRYQLKYNLKCTSELENLTDNISYKEKELLKFFIAYNTCKKDSFEIINQSKKRDLFNLNICPGIQYSSLDISFIHSDIYDVKFDNEIGIRLGIEAEFILPFNNNTWSINVEPTYQYYNSEKQISTQTVKVKSQSIDIPIGIRHYFFLTPNSTLFATGMVSFNFPFQSQVMWETYPSQELYLSNNLALGIGYQYKKKLGFEIRYGFKRNILTRYFYWESSYTTLSMIARYTLF